jgi:translation elongation factor EF-G
VKTDQATGEVVISGMGEQHLEIILDRLGPPWTVTLANSAPFRLT